jgi:PPM family protein phosphatase
MAMMRACPFCSSPTGEDDRYCENCGRSLSGASPGRGADAPTTADRDHVEIALSPVFAAVSDRGRRHEANEDAIAIGLGRDARGEAVHLLAVCDGVSTTFAPAEASRRGVEAWKNTAFAALAEGRSLMEAARLGVDAAQAAVCAIGRPPFQEPPATTLAAALVAGGRTVLAWMGDSRIYALDGSRGRLLTRDDSWLNAVVESGEFTIEEARRLPYAHAIVKCLGHMAKGETFAPNLLELPTPPGTALLLCSDGLWNYLEEPTEIAGEASGAGDALTMCRRLLDKANACGGRDNISVATLLLPAPARLS